MNLIKIIREEADDMWQNLIQGDANIWLSHQMIVFDETPTKEVVIKLIRDAFKSGLVKQESIDSWEDEVVEYEADIIIRNILPYLRIDLKEGWLYYGSYDNEVSKNHPGLSVINYSEAKDYLVNESDFTWITDEPINPWSQYSMIVFDEKPTREEINYYIELALNTRKISNKDAWRITDREMDINSILNYIEDRGGVVLKIDQWDDLQYASVSYYNSFHNAIRYSQLINKNLNESEEDEWAWTKGPINPWLGYDRIIMDTDITKEEINTYIELALSTRDIKYTFSWQRGREEDLITIQNNITTKNGSVLHIMNDSLSYCSYDFFISNYERMRYDTVATYKTIRLSELEKNINESEEEDEWAWAKESIFVDEVNIDDRIRVYNTGNEKAFLNWLGNYKQNYLNGEYGDYIEGTVTYESEDDFALSVKGKKYDVTIYFPFKNHIESIESMDDYKGLSLAYEIISKS
jgi:hypothetical protein